MYQGTAVSADRALPLREPGWVWVSGVPEVLQSGEKDCGPAALSAVLGYWGRPTTAQAIQSGLGHSSGERVQARELTAYARGLGFDSYVFNGAMQDVMSELHQGRPVIVGVAKQYGQKSWAHYEVVVGIRPSSQTILALDPADGWRQNSVPAFMKEWDPTGRVLLVVLPATREKGVP